MIIFREFWKKVLLAIVLGLKSNLLPSYCQRPGRYCVICQLTCVTSNIVGLVSSGRINGVNSYFVNRGGAILKYEANDSIDKIGVD